MGSKFIPLFTFILMLLGVLFVCADGTESNTDVCPDLDQTFYNTADRIHSIVTGNIYERGYDLHAESSSWCQNPVNFKYRSIDGTCNHPRNLGSTFKTFGRLLPAAYDNGIDSPRQHSEDGQALPSARQIRLRLHPPVDVFSKFTIALMNWGQWTDHDIAGTAETTSRVSCCGPNGEHLPNITDSNCFPIELPPNDPSFPGVCLHFTRSLAAEDSKGDKLKPRKQITAVTSFIDCSQIYGSTPETHFQVRVPRSFLLRTKNYNFLPESPTAGCNKRQGTDDYCFASGDARVNQNPFIAAMHTVWLREHNRIARKLKSLKPRSSNEEIFQLARKIVIAKNQIITYNAYLPHILGRDAKRWKLVSNKGRSFYNQDLDPSILVEFSSAAFRFGHSTISSLVPTRNSSELLRNHFDRPALVLDDLDGVLSGMAGLSNIRKTNMQTADRNIVEDISKFLFLNQATGQGLDLPTINIQRGRDHGIEPYVKWRSYCGLRPLTGFNDTKALGPFANELGTVYRSVNDIDLFTGMLNEPADTGLVGPTIRCILRIQFFRLKYGDRFFFNNDEPSSGFTDEQLNSLLKVTLSKVICQNTKIKFMPLDAFRFKSAKNQIVDCSVLKKEDLDLSVFA